MMKLMDGNALFVKFYFMPNVVNENSPFEMKPMPGIKEGISGTILVGYNIGIPGNIEEKKIIPAVEAVKYMTSRKIQKELVLKEYIISGISSIYEEEDTCSRIRFCDLYRHPQVITIPKEFINPNEDYSIKFTEYLYDYLFKNETASVVLEKMEELTKVYSFSLDTKETHVGLIIFIVFIITMILIISSLFLLHMEKYKNLYLLFLQESNWFIIILGILLILSAGFMKMGEITVFQCHLYCCLISIGFTLIYSPILYKLILTFPIDDNKYSLWINKNRILFYFLIIVIDLIFNALTLIKPYQVKNVIINEGKNYLKCDSGKNTFLKVIIFTFIGYKLIFALFMFLLIFIEWNLLKIKNDLKIIVISIYMNIFGFFMLFIFAKFNISNYIVYYLVEELLIFIITLSSFIILYLLRLFMPLLFKVDETSELFENFESTVSSNINPDKQKESMEKGKNDLSIISRILNYHKLQYTSTESTQSNINKSAQVESNV